MNWLKKKVIKWVREDWEKARADTSVGLRSNDYENRPDEEPILTFRIYSATNGQILEFRRWDRKTDRSNNSTYLVPKDTDIGEYVNKCLSMEMLK